MRLIEFGLPPKYILRIPTLDTPVPESPFENEFLRSMYYWSMKSSTPITIALIYFTSVHFLNKIITKKQIARYNKENKTTVTEPPAGVRMKAVPLSISTTFGFKLFVLLHNAFLCIYSVWTFISMTSYFAKSINMFTLQYFPSFISDFSLLVDKPSKFDGFIHSVCNEKIGAFSRFITEPGYHNLEILGYWFYISKFYEVIDTIIILMKGRPSSLLQSYHHAGAMMCMWSGIRFRAPPIWIFVVFNSFIHSLMYFYFTLSCLKIKVPVLFKKTLTSLQITQFVVGGSMALLNAGVKVLESVGDESVKFVSCIRTPDQALSLIINVGYLAPLTALFAAFYIESYLKKRLL